MLSLQTLITTMGGRNSTLRKCSKHLRKTIAFEIRIVRYHNIYGPKATYKGGREKSPAAVCRKVAEVSAPGEIEIWGDGKQTRSYCYID